MILHSVCSGIAFRYSGMTIPFFRKLQYKSMKIEDFMKNSYEYSKEHEEEIRRHIKASES